MTLPSSGSISIAQVASELGISTSGLNLNDARVRNLAGVPSGSIAMSQLHGKSSVQISTVNLAYKHMNYAVYADGSHRGYAAGYFRSGGLITYRPDGQAVNGANGYGEMSPLLTIRGANILFFGLTFYGTGESDVNVWVTLDRAVPAVGFSATLGSMLVNFGPMENGSTRFFGSTSHNVPYHWAALAGTWTVTIP